MKFKKNNFIIAIILFIIIACLNTSKAQSPFDRVEKLKKENLSMVIKLRQELNNMRKEIIKNNYKFKVSLTEALKRDLEKITGAKPPSNLDKIINSINNDNKEKYKKSLQSWDMFWKNKKQNQPSEPKCDTSLKKWDWRSLNAVTTVKEQGLCGACWAFSAASVLETALLIRYRKSLDLSEQYLIDCSKNPDHYLDEDTGNCDGGWYAGAFHYLKSNSAVLEHQAPYLSKESKCTKLKGIPYLTVTQGYVGKSKSEQIRDWKKERNAQKGVYRINEFKFFRNNRFTGVNYKTAGLMVRKLVEEKGPDIIFQIITSYKKESVYFKDALKNLTGYDENSLFHKTYGELKGQ